MGFIQKHRDRQTEWQRQKETAGELHKQSSISCECVLWFTKPRAARTPCSPNTVQPKPRAARTPCSPSPMQPKPHAAQAPSVSIRRVIAHVTDSLRHIAHLTSMTAFRRVTLWRRPPETCGPTAVLSPHPAVTSPAKQGAVTGPPPCIDAR